jgi:hypothetical protein
MSATGNPRPYRSQDDTSGNGVAFTARTLTAYLSKWDYDFEPQAFLNTYLADAAASNGNFAEAAATQMAKEYLDQITTSTLYSGVYNASGSTAAAICTGWGTIIADEITATNLTATTTTAPSGSNCVTQVETVINSCPAWMKSKELVVYVSHTTFEYFLQHYRTLNSYSFQPSATGEYRIDNRNAKIIPCDFMGSSARIIVTVPGNFVFGTNVESIQVAASQRRDIIECRPMFHAGCQIADLAALKVSSQA